jgi:hypothetical protein
MLSEMAKVKRIQVGSERFYFGFGFDMDDYIADGGAWWLQIYDDKRALVFDRNFASHMFKYCVWEVRSTVRTIILEEILYPRRVIL